MPDSLVNLEELTTADGADILALAGGKGFGLWQAVSADLSIPATRVVPSRELWTFKGLLRGDETPAELNTRARKFIAERLGWELAQLPGVRYAVRSSALVEDSSEQSFAGMFESRLGVNREDIPGAVAEVWLSGLAGRVGEYRHSSEWPEMAALIQPMIAARYAGVCFSAHPAPATLAENRHILIEFVTGLGDRLVQGGATPVRLSGNAAALAASTDYPWVRELLAAGARLEAATGARVDIEFAVDDAGALWILQQRPVTAAARSRALDLAGRRKAYKRALCSLDIEFLIDGCGHYLAPYLEIPVDLAAWMAMVTNPEDGQQELWVDEFTDDLTVREVVERIRDDESYLERLEARFDHHHRRILAWRTAAWADPALPLSRRLQDFFEFIVPLNAHYYAPMHVIEALSRLLIDAMRAAAPETADDDFHRLATSGVSTLGGMFARELDNVRRDLMARTDEVPKSVTLLSPLFQDRLESIVERYGFLNCRQPYEAPYAAKDLLAMLREAADGEAETGHEPAIGELRRIYGQCAGWEMWAAAFIHWLNLRNQEMEYLYFAYAKAAPLLREVGDRLGLSLEEVWNRDRDSLLARLRHGALPAPPDRRRLAIAHDGSRVLVSDHLQILYPADTGGSAGLRGRTVFGQGEVTGLVKIAFTPDELAGIGEGPEPPVIVTGMTTPDFVPFLANRAAALITDEGGILCHASIIAREIRLPCVVGTGVATEKLRDGTLVTIDLDRGTVSIVPGP